MKAVICTRWGPPEDGFNGPRWRRIFRMAAALSTAAHTAGHPDAVGQILAGLSSGQ